MSLTKEKAASFLSSVPDQNKFWCCDGSVFNNLEELESCFVAMKSETFKHHVNAEKNDFSNWIYDCVGDVELANGIRKSSDKKSILKKIKARVTQLKHALK